MWGGWVNLGMGEMGVRIRVKWVKLWVNGCVGVGKRWEMWVILGKTWENVGKCG